MAIENGYIILARQVIESDIWQTKPDKWLKIWLYILLKVNHKSNKQFERGSNFMRYDWISAETGATQNSIDHCIRWLKQAKQIATRKATRGMVIKVLNYDKYQQSDNYKSDTKSDKKSEIKAIQKRNRGDTINKNGKKEKKDNILSATADEPYSFNSKVNSMLASKDRRMPIIAYYWVVKGIKFKNLEQYESGLKRELRASSLLKGYENKRIKEVVAWLNHQDFKFTLETVHKYIDEDLTKLDARTLTEDEKIKQLLKR